MCIRGFYFVSFLFFLSPLGEKGNSCFMVLQDGLSTGFYFWQEGKSIKRSTILTLLRRRPYCYVHTQLLFIPATYIAHLLGHRKLDYLFNGCLFSQRVEKMCLVFNMKQNKTEESSIYLATLANTLIKTLIQGFSCIFHTG